MCRSINCQNCSKMQCIRCLNVYNDTKSYFQHLHEQHHLRGKDRYVCTLCDEVLNRLEKYKKHVETCFRKNQNQNENEQSRQNAFLEAYNDCEMEDIGVTVFKETVKNAALKLTSKMSANMTIPRSLVYENISQFQTFIETIVEGMNSVMLPRVHPQDKTTAKDFIDAVSSSLDTVNSESNFESELLKAKLMDNFEKCVMFEDENEENGNILMPISFQIKKFLEMPGVFDKIRRNTAELQAQNRLNNFINGSLWKEKIQSFKEDDFVIPYHFYADAAQLNHPMGPHCAKGKEEFNYYSFPTVPTQYQSQLKNIFVASMFPANYTKTFSLEEIYSNIVEEFTKLAKDGLVLSINGTDEKVFLVCGLFLGDNLEANTVLSFVRGFHANYYCRYCRLHISEMQHTTVEDPELRRNRENYENDVLIHNKTQSGVREYSVWNYIPHFHVTESSAQDITHSVDEGVCHYNLKEILHYFIYDEQYFTLELLNRRMRSFPYGHEKSNVPQPIKRDVFKKTKKAPKRKFSMTASEMANFVQNITFMIGDLVPEDDIIWHFLLTTVKFYDTCYLPSYTDDEIEEWKNEISYMLTSYQNLFGKPLNPVHHMTIHFPRDTLRYGPLRYTRTIRFEGKHKELKGYSSNTNNRMNISYSLAKKVQYNFANRLLEAKGLDDEIHAKYDPGTAEVKVYWPKVAPSEYKTQLSEKQCCFTEQISVNGMLFAVGLWLPDFSERKEIHEVIDIIVATPKNVQDIFAVCKTYTQIEENDHFGSYCVERSSLQDEFSLINIEHFLTLHQYPVKVHNILGESLFRCKRF